MSHSPTLCFFGWWVCFVFSILSGTTAEEQEYIQLSWSAATNTGTVLFKQLTLRKLISPASDQKLQALQCHVN